MSDKIDVEILDDGKVKVETGPISGPNHMNAEKMMRFLREELGPETSKVRKAHHHHHVHEKEFAKN